MTRRPSSALIGAQLLVACAGCGPEEVSVVDGAAQHMAAQGTRPAGIELFLGDYQGVCADLQGPGLRAGARVIYLYLPDPTGATPAEQTYSVPPTTATFDPIQPQPTPFSGETSQVAGTVEITERAPSVIGSLDLDASYQTGSKVRFVGDFTIAYCAYPPPTSS